MRAGSRNALAVLLCASPWAAFGAQWLAVPHMTLGADTDTNRRLSAEPRGSESGVLAASAYLARATATDTLSLVPRVTISRYSDGDALDSEDWAANAQWRHEGERLRFDLDAGIADDSTLVTELGETGFVEGNTRRRAGSAAATLTQYLETRHLLQYALSATDIDYQRSRDTGLVGYRYPSASLLYVFSNTARVSTTFHVSAARLEAPDVNVRTDTRGAQLGMRFRATERCELEARVGSTATSAHGRTDHDRSFRAGATWNNEISSFELSASRDVEPSGRGVLVQADDLRLRFTRALTERLSLDTSLRASRREDLYLAGSRVEYRYGTVAATLSLKLEEAWTLALAGVFSRQEYAARDSADGTRVGLTLSWRPPQP